MKGKVLSFKIIFVMLVLLASSFCFGIGRLPQIKIQNEVHAASTKVTINDNDYSAVFKGNLNNEKDDLIFSVEKVMLGSYDPTTTGVKTFLGVDKNTEMETPIYFKDIKNGLKSKTVVDNGEFVVLDNVLTNNNLHIEGSLGEREGLIVSFGAYVYNGETVEIAENKTPIENSVYSPITHMVVSLEVNGVQVPQSEMPYIRDIAISEQGLFFDFVQVLDQKLNDSNEGYYKYTIKYTIDHVEHVETFEFYVLNRISYTRSHDITQGYNAKPTLGWLGGTAFEKTDYNNGYIRYKIGVDGLNNLDQTISYPTITYDYTKYNLSFIHTANQKNTTYVFERQYNTTLSNQTAQLNYTITSSERVVSDNQIMEDYKKENSFNLVTIMLTQPGTYKITYSYIYDGFNANNAPKFETSEIRFAIHGMESYYSKTDYESANLQYYQIAKKQNDYVDLFVTNGYELNADMESLKDKKLGFVYELVDSDEREGTILSSNSIDALVNHQLKDQVTYTPTIKSSFDFLVRENSVVTSVAGAITKDNIRDFDNVLSKISYAPTNQGSIWLGGNDVYVPAESVYWYSPTPITASSIYDIAKDPDGNITGITKKTQSIEKQYTNTTTFNKKGYYLVFIKIDNNGMSNGQFWQVFAFQYTSSSVNINIEAIINDKGTANILDDETQVVAGGKYTTKDVRISWAKPGIFDRAIKGYYFSVTNSNYDREQLLTTPKQELNEIELENSFIAELGSEVNAGTFVKYLIRLESEGEGATHKIFTIDRQPISGVQPYLIEEMYSGNTLFYAFSTDRYNNIVPISNSITNQFATITWNDKASGAETYASYNFTPFVQSSTVDPTSITGKDGKSWITTNYSLGTTLEGYAFEKSESIYTVSSGNVLSNQGIYIIKIWDSAGNETYYSFVIDRTDNYFKVGDSYISKGYKIFGDDVEYSIGDSKVFELSSTNDELNDFIDKAVSNNLGEFKNGLYYNGVYNNIYVISNYFQKVGSVKYFTVENTRVIGFDTEKKQDNYISNTSGVLSYSVDKGESYYKRTIFAIGDNHTIFKQNVRDITYNAVQDNSYVTVEINKDNARGFVYYSTSKIEAFPLNGESTGSVIRLDTGSDNKDENDVEIASGMLGARATSANHVSFIWNMGTGKFEVAQVYYNYYVLDPKAFNPIKDGKYYFYSSEDDPVYVYDNGWKEGGEVGGGRGAFSFNGESQTKPGLYVVTRVYKDDGTVDFGDDSKEKNYYFIVDRNQIIDLSQNIGNDIELQLLENEIEYNNFSISGTDYDIFSNAEDKIYNQRYNIYLSTTKLPAILNVPIGKYLDENHTSGDYYAGKLNVSIYFNDLYGQLEGADKNSTKKIFDSGKARINDGVYNIDIYSYLTNVNQVLRNRITAGSENGNWLFLSGDYIIRITDNVQDALGKPHEKYIGLRIKGKGDNGPQVDSYTGFDKLNVAKIIINNDEQFHYSATVSQEYLKVELPKYVSTITNKAQVDPDYFVATQYYGYNAKGVSYINHPNEQKDGYLFKDYNSGIVENNDGVITVWLDTKLKVNGVVDIQNLHVPLYYTITVRYKIGNEDDSMRYANCYVYYDDEGKPVPYYQATYTIAIDREAPNENISYLNSQDAFVKEYNQEFGTNEMMANGVHATNSNLYFTKQYDKYYSTNKVNKGYIYAYQVDSNTPFNKQGIKYVFYKNIADLSSYNLSLPMINESGYTRADAIFDVYGGLELTGNNYYEIIEQDAAGNTTQYVVHYKPSRPNIILPISFNTTKGTVENKNVSIEENVDTYIYGLTANGDANIENVLYFKITLSRSNGDEVLKILTNPATNFGQINSTIVDVLQNCGYGNYILSISARKIKEPTELLGVIIGRSNINMYDRNDVIAIQIEKLVEKVGENYYINLHGANEPNDTGDLMFFATEITVRSSRDPDVTIVYSGRISDETGKVIYTEVDGTLRDKIPCLADTTYYLTMTDVLGSKDNHRFNTNGKDFYRITFENPNAETYDNSYYLSNAGINATYYGYTSARVQYDPIFEAELYYLKGEDEIKQTFTPVLIDGYNEVYVNAEYDDGGKIVKARIDLYEEGRFELSYFIVIDTRLSSVALRDFNSGEQREVIRIFNNANYDDEEVRSNESATGILNMQWNKLEENSYFDYVYTLYELSNKTYKRYNLVNGVYVEDENGSYLGLPLTDKTSHVIATREGSEGIYKFEIKVYGKDGTYLGNRIFAFEVHETSTQIYYVRNKKGEGIAANSKFKVSELSTQLQLKIKGTESAPGIFPNININVSLPLYISNQELTVVLTAPQVEPTFEVIEDFAKYKFIIYKLSKEDVFDIYVGLLEIQETPKLVSSVMLNGKNVIDSTPITISGDVDDEVLIQSSIIPESNVLLQKNTLQMEIHYGNRFVKAVEYTGAFEIKGNGAYKFYIKDLAGNVHTYENGVDHLDVYMLREVVVTINDEVPIENGFYNDKVELSIYASSKYVTGSISIDAKKNGETYNPQGFNPYIFDSYGTYRVVITAKFNDGLTEIPLSKIITFTVINVKEARKSIDLTALKGHEISKVLNPYGQDKTSEFKQMIDNNNGDMNITYESVIDYADKLNVTAGKITFTITYVAKETINFYPNRTVDFSFTLNNENPVIECSMEKGDSTTKGFSIFFNPAIIYEQIGEAYIYINDSVAMVINEDSVNEEIQIETTYKANGDGDYYIKVVGTSGVVWDSFKVTIKEPLNFWAIVVILVVVGVIATITISIIVLRRKMRIR